MTLQRAVHDIFWNPVPFWPRLFARVSTGDDDKHTNFPLKFWFSGQNFWGSGLALSIDQTATLASLPVLSEAMSAPGIDMTASASAALAAVGGRQPG